MTIGPILEDEARRYFLREAEELAGAHSPPAWAEVQRVLREGCAVVRTQEEALSYTISRWQYYGDKNRAEIEQLRREVKFLRAWGNKHCTAMADEAMEAEEALAIAAKERI